MTTREAFADAIAPLPDYRRALAWKYVGQIEALARKLAECAKEADEESGTVSLETTLSPEEKTLLYKVQGLGL